MNADVRFAHTAAALTARRLGEPPLRLNPFAFVLLYAGMASLCILVTEPASSWLNWYITIAWSLYFPVALVGMGRVLLKGDAVVARSTWVGATDKKIIFVLPTVCRKNTLPALKRVLNSILLYAPRSLRNWRVDIVVDEGAEALEELRAFVAWHEKLCVVEIPAHYQTPRRTRAKARANHYAAKLRRRRKETRANVYVYHLDDDTHVREDTMASIAEFVETFHGRYYLAQGVLTFPHELTSSTFFALADSIRPGDDITRCGFFTHDLGTPLGGLHGEHLLIRADIEEEIGWDFGDTLVEDAYFALCFAQKYPGKAHGLNSFSYGASPATFGDFVRQRRRWAAGLLDLAFGKNGLPLTVRLPLMYSVACWMVGPFQFVAVVLLLAWWSGTGNTSPVVLPCIFLWSFNLAYSVWQYMEGLRINVYVSQLPKGNRLALSLAMIPLVYVFTVVEGIAALAGLVKFLKRDHAFEVITKET